MSRQDRFYEIDFTNGSDVETLRYQLVDNPVADVWYNIVEGALSTSNCHIASNQWIQKAPNDSIDSLWCRMKTLVDDLNTGRYGQMTQLFMPAKFDPNVDHSDLLNYLHLQFHKFGEQGQNHSKDNNPLIELNFIIHNIESVLQNGPMSCGFHLEWSYSTTIPRVIDIEDMNLYKCWTLSRKFGDMTLGYHTIGKNLWMCYKDNDVDLVKSGMVRPQRTISSEVNLIFRGDVRRRWKDVHHTAKNNDFLRMCKWMESNNLTQYVDMSKPYNCAIGQPLLGRLISSYTYTDIGRILSLGRVSAVRLT
jgi:hypothetical protein